MVKRNMPGFSTKNAGFTLIEVMVAVAITAIIGVVLTASIFQIMTVQSSTKDRVDAVKQVENALHYVNQDAQMAFPGQSPVNNSSNYFRSTTLTAAAAVGSHSLSLASAAGFVAPGTVVVGTGANAETLAFTAVTGNTLTTAAVAKAHSLNSPVANAMTLKWLDNAGSSHRVSYYLQSVSGVIYLARSETIGAGQAATLNLARAVDSTNSYYTFDGHVLNITLTSAVSGFRSATETRTLAVQFRPTL
jgi:prepilin-type N-terminal cleavage/methylation domain-containing protein